MKGFTDKKGKFHPIRKKRYSKVRKAIIPKLELKLPKRERDQSFAQIEADIKRDGKLKERLVTDNDVLADKIEANPKSDFTLPRKEMIRDNNQVIKEINKDLKQNLRKLDREERRQLSDDIKDLSRFLR